MSEGKMVAAAEEFWQAVLAGVSLHLSVWSVAALLAILALPACSLALECLCVCVFAQEE
jgi:hypothetical protein